MLIYVINKKGESMSEADNIPTCCICGSSCADGAKNPKWVLGNNPWPVSDDPNDRACDECNFFVVVPERLKKAKVDIVQGKFSRKEVQ